MMKKNIWTLLLYLIILLFAEKIGYAESERNWRFWTSDDGLPGSFTRVCNVNWDDTIWIGHSEVSQMTWLDGYTLHHIPASEISIPVYRTPQGQIWSAFWKQRWQALGGFQQFADKKWIRYPVKEADQTKEPYFLFFPISNDRVLFLLPSRLMEFHARRQQTTECLNVNDTGIHTFNDMCRSEDGIIITGDQGAGKLRVGKDAGPSSYSWEEFLLSEDMNFHDLRRPFETKDGAIYASAHMKDTSGSVFLKYDDKEWEALYCTEQKNQIFIPGLDETFWMITEDPGSLGFGMGIFTLRKVEKNQENPISGNQVLSGSIFDFDIQAEGVLWLATSQGVARYAPLLWRTPPKVAPIQTNCHAIHEDQKGRLWFLCQDKLVLLQNEQWTFIDLPEQSNWYSKTGLLSLPNGHLRIPVYHNTLVFNPESMTFYYLQHPENNRRLRYFQAGPNNTLLIESVGNNTKRLEMYDGDTYQTILERDQWGVSDEGNFHAAQIIDNGTIFIGGATGLARYQNGNYQIMGPEEGLPIQFDGALNLLDIGDSTIWIGGRKKILQYKDNRFIEIAEIGRIYNMTKADDGSIWVASEKGIYHFFNGSSISYSQEDGLPEATMQTVFQDSHGRVWAGTTRGISLFHPEMDIDPPDTWMSRGKNIAEVSSRGEAQFIFSGIDKWKYTKQDRLLYSHRFDESEWSSYSGETIVSATGLYPGSHRFKVRAIDRNGNIDPTPAYFNFTVLRPWYQEPEFLIILTIGSFLILFFAGYALNRHLHLQHSYKQLNDSNAQLNEMNVVLQEANAELQQLDQMKSQFVSQASHDLRTPLTAIKGSLENLLMGIAGDLNEKQAKIMSRATKSVDRLTILINDVLDLNRIEAGRIVLEKSNVPFKTLVENIVNENQPAADQKQIKLTFNSHAGDFTLHIDGGKIFRVVGELISNAIKYTPEGGSVDVNLSKQQDQIILKVKDSGIGMTLEECEKIWERFYRTNASKKFAKGSGLGLSIAKELVELHKGTLTVKSEQGKGTVFILQISERYKNEN